MWHSATLPLPCGGNLTPTERLAAAASQLADVKARRQADAVEAAEAAPPKRVHGRYVSATELFEFIRSYAKLFKLERARNQTNTLLSCSIA